MAQTWHDLLFAHWPIPIDVLRRSIPPALEIDSFEGRAWLGVVSFRMSGVRLRGTPPLPWISAFPELNLRTYVKQGDKPGVWFFALDAGNALAVAVARAWFHLPYFRAKMKLRVADGDIEYESRRAHRGAHAAELDVRYGPRGDVEMSRRGTLEHWLTERYCLYAADERQRIWRGDIHHPPWPLQPAHAEFRRCSMPEAHGLELPSTPPLCQFARRLDVLIWAPKQTSGGE
jgi:uncharacterized protein YqjF (DUF2071 family)